MKKILFCDNSLRELINFREDVINSYAKDGYDVILVAPCNMEYLPPYPNIRHVHISFSRSSKNPFSEMSYLIRLFRIYRKEQPDYIFHYTIKPNIYGNIAAKLCGIRSTSIVAGLGYAFNKGGVGNMVARILFRFSMQFAEYIIVLNTYNRDLLLSKRIAQSSQIILLTGGEGINLEYYKVDE